MKKCGHCLAIEITRLTTGQIKRERRGRIDRPQVLREESALPSMLELLAKRPLNLLKVIIDTLERTILLEEFCRTLLTNSLHSRDIV